MNTYQLIEELVNRLSKDFENPNNNSTYKDAIKDALSSLNNLKSFY